jgi:hypothetical protein
MLTKWIRCDDLDVAAAFGTLGVPMRTKVQVRADNGKEYVTVWLATESVTRPGFKTAETMRLLKEGKLQQADPESPLLYALEGIKNSHALGASIRTTERVIMMTRKGTMRTAYVKESAKPKEFETAGRFLQGIDP